jgi:hypothetical protein
LFGFTEESTVRIVTTEELVRGMLVYEYDPVNPDREAYNYDLYIVGNITVQSDGFFESGRFEFVHAIDAWMGMLTGELKQYKDTKWVVIDDQEVLDKVRANVKKDINRHRDYMTEVERLVDASL